MSNDQRQWARTSASNVDEMNIESVDCDDELW